MHLWWADQRNGFTLIAPIDAEIGFVDSDDMMAWKHFAHTDQAQVGQVRPAIVKAPGKIAEGFYLTTAIEGEPNQPVLHHAKRQFAGTNVKSGFR
jgi:hypothetical protein